MRPEPFDAGRDFAAIAFVALDTNGLFSSAALPPPSVEELIAWVRAQPNPVPYASSGVGTLGHLGMELFARARDLRMTHVPYRGAGPAMADVVSGTAAAIFTGAIGGRALAEAGRLRLIAVTGARRHADFPAVPTVHELGLGSMDVPVWHGYMASPGTPQPILARLHAAFVAILGDAEFLASLGVADSGVSALIRGAYHLLGLATYFTAGEKEVRAWTFRQGMTAPQCAGVIHTDFEKGFIKAEVVAYDDLRQLGSVAAARDAGKYRLEGRDYLFKDGEVALFRFAN
jgi:hypothetical protein